MITGKKCILSWLTIIKWSNQCRIILLTYFFTAQMATGVGEMSKGQDSSMAGSSSFLRSHPICCILRGIHLKGFPVIFHYGPFFVSFLTPIIICNYFIHLVPVSALSPLLECKLHDSRDLVWYSFFSPWYLELGTFNKHLLNEWVNEWRGNLGMQSASPQVNFFLLTCICCLQFENLPKTFLWY